MRREDSSPREVPALRVRQWLKEWERVRFEEGPHRKRPDPHFYLFALAASDLKALSGIHRRTTEGGLLRSCDLGIQRRHDEDRSKEIGEFVRFGYPWSELSETRRKSRQFDDLRKPGWLPTAIVVNILKPGDVRRGESVAPNDLITVTERDRTSGLIGLPGSFTGADWVPQGLHPIEIIDGQHRLWAFGPSAAFGGFELPVVAFHGLDISWQAYLFWTINIKPKRINASLAFDLYPLLRTEDWLERFEGHAIYRQTRAQELTEALWAHSESPWYQRINMLGESGMDQAMVSQAAWIRSLMATYVKAWESPRARIGGLFGAPLGKDEEVLPWSRAEQAAFLMLVGHKVKDAIQRCDEEWAKALRSMSQPTLFEPDQSPAFVGSFTLLSTDQGIRGMLHVTNDLCYVCARQLDLEHCAKGEDAGATDEEAASRALREFTKRPVSEFLTRIAEGLAKYDWRTSSAAHLTNEQKTAKLAFRGSGGYKELRRQLLRHLAEQEGEVGAASQEALLALGYHLS